MEFAKTIIHKFKSWSCPAVIKSNDTVKIYNTEITTYLSDSYYLSTFITHGIEINEIYVCRSATY